MEYSIIFIEVFFQGIYFMSPILLMLFTLILLLGLLAGYFESWRKFDSIYWSLITASTIGYGDIRPLKKRSKFLSIVIGILGLMLGGIIVAITVEAASKSIETHVALHEIHRITLG